MKLNAKILIACAFLTFTSLDLLSARHRPHNRREIRAAQHVQKPHEVSHDTSVVVYTAWRRHPHHRYTVGFHPVANKFYNEGQTIQALVESARPHCRHLGPQLSAFAATPNQPNSHLNANQELDLKQQLAHRSIVIVSENDAQAIRDKTLHVALQRESHPLSARAQRRANLKQQQEQAAFKKMIGDAAHQKEEKQAVAHRAQQPMQQQNPISSQPIQTTTEQLNINSIQFETYKEGLINKDLDKDNKPNPSMPTANKDNDKIDEVLFGICVFNKG